MYEFLIDFIKGKGNLGIVVRRIAMLQSHGQLRQEGNLSTKDVRLEGPRLPREQSMSNSGTVAHVESSKTETCAGTAKVLSWKPSQWTRPIRSRYEASEGSRYGELESFSKQFSVSQELTVPRFGKYVVGISQMSCSLTSVRCMLLVSRGAVCRGAEDRSCDTSY